MNRWNRIIDPFPLGRVYLIFKLWPGQLMWTNEVDFGFQLVWKEVIYEIPNDEYATFKELGFRVSSCGVASIDVICILECWGY